MELLHVKLRGGNLFFTTKILCIGDHTHIPRALRPLAAALDALDTPGDCAAAATRPTPRPLQSYTSAGGRRLPIVNGECPCCPLVRGVATWAAAALTSDETAPRQLGSAASRESLRSTATLGLAAF